VPSCFKASLGETLSLSEAAKADFENDWSRNFDVRRDESGEERSGEGEKGK
jgi:hypothetical protein